MQDVFSIDGKYYDVLVGSIKRQAKIEEGKESGTLINGSYDRDLIGTYYEYDVEFGVNKLNPAEYDELYECLTEPTEYHTIIMPYGQSTLTFTAYIDSVTDEYVKVIAGNKLWRGMSVTFTSQAPIKEIS